MYKGHHQYRNRNDSNSKHLNQIEITLFHQISPEGLLPGLYPGDRRPIFEPLWIIGLIDCCEKKVFLSIHAWKD